jgi:hypothetical protein
MLYTSKLATICNRVIQTFDIAFIRAVMQWGLRRQVPVIHVHHAAHVLCNCSHTNKIGVKHKEVAYVVRPEYLKPRGQTGLLQLTVPPNYFSLLLKIRSQNTCS